MILVKTFPLLTAVTFLQVKSILNIKILFSSGSKVFPLRSYKQFVKAKASSLNIISETFLSDRENISEKFVKTVFT